MQKVLKRALAVGMTATMAVGMLAGCGGGGIKVLPPKKQN